MNRIVMRVFISSRVVLFGFILSNVPTLAQDRVPATPLITHNPSFSIWSTADHLYDADTTHWTGARQALAGLAYIDGKPFRFMGRNPERVPAMVQVSSSVTATHTSYEFREGGVELDFTLFTPVMMSDLDVLSRPVTYLTWSAHALDAGTHHVAVVVDADPVLAVNDPSEKVLTFRNETSSLHVLSVGSRDQNVLDRSGDNVRINWGYFHLAVPKNEPSMLVIAHRSLDAFANSGHLPVSDSIGMPESASQTAHLDAELDFGTVSAATVSLHLLVAYTQGYAIQYLQRNLRPYWERNGMPVQDMLDDAEAQYADLDARGSRFDQQLQADLTKVGGTHYSAIAILAYRQTLAAHELAADEDGNPMLFPKENFSNGCISTVDVLYPSSPFFLFFQPKLLEAQLLPVLEYAALPRWRFPFAPHDLGTFPLANGQVYGGGEKTQEDQMPVEESGNMLIMVDALARAEGNPHLAERFWPQLTSWANYLKQKGLDPENQLTTDDFAGHVAHNANLSIKAIDALAAYADLAHLLHHEEAAKDYRATAKSMASQWLSMAAEGDHYKLAFNSQGTWSQKYNLVWDRILGYDLFPERVRDAEVAFYLTRLNRYGLPLDSRADYTKLDWSLWTATLAAKPEDFSAIIAPIYRWIQETPTRVPLTDWYDTKTGKQVGFQARSVVGGIFIKALSDKQLAEKYHAEAGESPKP